jgi:mono/diheme cytochrome c family protein
MRSELPRQHMMGGWRWRRAPITESTPPRLDLSTAAGDLRAGAALFGQRCSDCHGTAGRRDVTAAASLLPHPANLTAARFSSRRLAGVLWNGVPGTAMPRFRDVPLRDLRAIASHVASLGNGRAGIGEEAAQPRAAKEAGLARI